MNEWLGTNPGELCDTELTERISELEAARIRLDAAELATIGEWDARMVWATDGATGGPAWLRAHTGMAGSTAREKVRVARALRHMPVVAAAFAAGEISYAKVRLLAGCRNPHTEAVFARDEELLVGFARQFGTDQLAKVLTHWKACADPDGTSADAAQQWTRRGATVAQTLSGTGVLHGLFDPESYAVFTAELDAIVGELWRNDRRDHDNEAHIVGVAAARQPRTYPQLRLDALVEMARRSAGCDIGTATRGRTELIAMIDYETLIASKGGIAETTTGALLTGDAARRLACDTGIVRAVVAGQSQILDLGRATPVPNAAQRRAVALRWDGCFWPGCDRPVNWTQLHHLNPYRRGHPTGGNTNTNDLLPGCTCHHPLLHEGGYTATRDPHTDTIHIHRPDGTHLYTITPNGPITRRPTQTTQPQMTNA